MITNYYNCAYATCIYIHVGEYNIIPVWRYGDTTYNPASIANYMIDYKSNITSSLIQNHACAMNKCF